MFWSHFIEATQANGCKFLHNVHVNIINAYKRPIVYRDVSKELIAGSKTTVAQYEITEKLSGDPEKDKPYSSVTQMRHMIFSRIPAEEKLRLVRKSVIVEAATTVYKTNCVD